jgi:D-alanine-D-alanine ligase
LKICGKNEAYRDSLRIQTVRIAVLFGGTSEERDVSIASAAQIIPALRTLGHEVFAVDTATGRLPAADEQKLLAKAVSADPPSSAAISGVRGRAVAFATSGISFPELLERICKGAIKR